MVDDGYDQITTHINPRFTLGADKLIWTHSDNAIRSRTIGQK